MSKRAAGQSIAPAVFARVHDAGRQTARPDRAEHRFEACELLACERIVGLVGNREMGADPGEPQLRAVDDLRGELDRVVDAAADPVHAGVDLEVHVELVVGTAVGHRLGQRVDAGERVHDRREAVRDDARRRGRYRLRQHEDRRVDTRVAQLDPLLDQRDAETGRAGFERGARDGYRAVAVTLGLHDREHARRCRHLAQRPDVGAHGVEIDLRPHGPELRHRRRLPQPVPARLLRIHVSQGSRPLRNT